MVRPAGGRTSIGRRRPRSVARVFVLFCRDWVGREEQRVDERPLAPRGSPAAPASGFCARLCLSRRGAAPARRRRAFAWRCAHAQGSVHSPTTTLYAHASQAHSADKLTQSSPFIHSFAGAGGGLCRELTQASAHAAEWRPAEHIQNTSNTSICSAGEFSPSSNIANQCINKI